MLQEGLDPSNAVEFGAKSWLQANDVCEGRGSREVMLSESKSGFHCTWVNEKGWCWVKGLVVLIVPLTAMVIVLTGRLAMSSSPPPQQHRLNLTCPFPLSAPNTSRLL
jgi:hypothetical protein